MDSKELSMKSIVLWGGIAILIAVIVIAAVKFASPGGDGGEVTGVLPEVSPTDWVLGASTSPLTLIEYSDFQCPACGSYFPTVERVVQDYKNSIRFVYRHFPLPYHGQAKPAAYAAEAAGKQGKFWEMYRLLFENQRAWTGKSDSARIFETYAERLNLNLEQYKTDVVSSEVRAHVDEQYRGGGQANVNATPTFFLNGTKLQNVSSYDSFKKYLDAAIASSTP